MAITKNFKQKTPNPTAYYEDASGVPALNVGGGITLLNPEGQTIYNFADDYALLDQVDATHFYYGFIASGQSDEADPLCVIVYMEKTGTVWTRKWSNGVDTRDVNWSDRTTTTYKFLG